MLRKYGKNIVCHSFYYTKHHLQKCLWQRYFLCFYAFVKSEFHCKMILWIEMTTFLNWKLLTLHNVQLIAHFEGKANKSYCEIIYFISSHFMIFEKIHFCGHFNSLSQQCKTNQSKPFWTRTLSVISTYKCTQSLMLMCLNFCKPEIPFWCVYAWFVYVYIGRDVGCTSSEFKNLSYSKFFSDINLRLIKNKS